MFILYSLWFDALECAVSLVFCCCLSFEHAFNVISTMHGSRANQQEER